MANTRTVLSDMRVSAALELSSSLTAGDSYVYVSDPTPFSGAPPAVIASPAEARHLYSDAIAGKLVTAADSSPVIRAIPWVAGKTFDTYDDQVDLSQADFYTVVNAGAFSHVWKCMENGSGAPSTQQPAVADLGGSLELFLTADGYRWRYMYSVSSATVSKFASTEWFPLGSNASVTAGAVRGAVDQVLVDDPGAGYSNYLTGTLSVSDITVGNATTYSVASNSLASFVSGFYTGCLFYISSGTGVGQARVIVDSFSNSTGRYVVLASPLSPTPTSTTTWDIHPSVAITGRGQSSNALARAIVNSVSNSIYRVEIISPGAGYVSHSAVVVANSAVAVSHPASVRSVYGPRGGHGSNCAAELLATSVAVSVTLANSESNTISTVASFRRIGLARSVQFANVYATLTNATGSFVTGDAVAAVAFARPLAANASTTQGSAVVSLASASSLLEAGDEVYLVSSDATSHQVAAVSSANSTAVVLASNALWSCTAVTVSLAATPSAGVVNSVPDGSHLLLDSCTAQTAPGAVLVDRVTGARAVVNAVSRGGISPRDYSTFSALWQLTLSGATGSPQYGETWLFSSGATATYVSSNSTVARVASLTGPAIGFTYVGQSSGATGSVTAFQPPEVDPGSGEELFSESVSPVQRSSTTSEDLIVYVGF